MKKIFSLLSFRRISLGFVLTSLVVVLVLFLVVFHSFALFAKNYGAYEMVAAEHTNAAYIPSTNDNPVRQELNRLLAESLAKELPVADRLSHARRGLELLKVTEGQIDRIGNKGEEVTAAIIQLDSVSSGVGALPFRIPMKRMVDLAYKRFQYVADVRGLSYRANYHTAEIFNRIIRDNGELTREHVLELNSALPLLEQQFDKRTNTYTQLQNTTVLLDNERDTLWGGFWGWVYRTL